MTKKIKNIHPGDVLKEEFLIPMSISVSVTLSEALPANVLERRTKPLPSNTMPSVTRGQSLRFSFDRPYCALGLAAAPPLQSKCWSGHTA